MKPKNSIWMVLLALVALLALSQLTKKDPGNGPANSPATSVEPSAEAPSTRPSAPIHSEPKGSQRTTSKGSDPTSREVGTPEKDVDPPGDRSGRAKTHAEASAEPAALNPEVTKKPVRRFLDGVTIVDNRTDRVVQRGRIELGPTLDRIARGEHFPHRNDGAVFQNRPLPGKNSPELPRRPQGYYHEYVHPTPGISGPGPQRIVIGQDGETYYTPDHYETFIRLD